MTEEELELFLNQSPSAIRTRWKYWLDNGEIVTPIFVEEIMED